MAKKGEKAAKRLIIRVSNRSPYGLYIILLGLFLFKICEGARCETCIPLPGCERGTCNEALECNCEAQWAGAYCEIRKSKKVFCLFFKLKSHHNN